jgi:dihydroorotase
MKLLLEKCLIDDKITNLLVTEDRIGYIGNEPVKYDKKIDLEGKLVLSGMIDPHVHVRDLGQAYKEDWNSVGMAGACGGVTTILDMPNTIPPTTNMTNLKLKKDKAKASIINYGFNIGAVGDNLGELNNMLQSGEKGIAGIKLFMTASSSNEYLTDSKSISEVFRLGKRYGLPVLVHTELGYLIDEYRQKYSGDEYNSVRYHNQIRNRQCAVEGTELALKLATEVGNELYIVHVSVWEEIELIRRYRKEHGTKVCCEVTPHHLLLNESVLERAGNYGKVNPPLRTKKDNEALWEAIIDGTADCIGSDHAPHTVEEKNRPYFNAPSGFPGLETSLPLLVNEYANGQLSYRQLTKLIGGNTAKIFGIKDRGSLKIGNYADITVIDTDKTYRIDASRFRSKAHYSPYQGMGVRGEVYLTIVNGDIVYHNGKIINEDLGKEIEYD